MPQCLPRRDGDHHQPSAKDSENNSADTPDYLNIMTSEFMDRLFSEGKSRRRASQREREFEEALERQKQKQARSDEFFDIYRQVILLVRSGQHVDWILP